MVAIWVLEVVADRDMAAVALPATAGDQCRVAARLLQRVAPEVLMTPALTIVRSALLVRSLRRAASAAVAQAVTAAAAAAAIPAVPADRIKVVALPVQVLSAAAVVHLIMDSTKAIQREQMAETAVLPFRSRYRRCALVHQLP